MRSFLRVAASLLAIVFALTAQADWTKVRQEFKQGKTHDEAVKKLSETDEAKREGLESLISEYREGKSKSEKEDSFNAIQSYLDSSVLGVKYDTVKEADAKAKDIKKDPIYTRDKESSRSNWLSKLLERLKKLFEGEPNTQQTPDLPNVPLWIGSLVRIVFYILCAAIVCGLIYLLFKIPWGAIGRKKTKRTRGGMLEEGEELLSEDEYLLEADRLVAEGRYREACRALYLASLLRLDSSRIARFESTQTNWEHLRRVEASKTLPEGLEFREATKAFDLAWYGYRATSVGHVDIFRETYLNIKRLTGVIG